MSNEFERLTDGIGQAIEAVPELYEDALKPAAKESGKTLALVPRAVNAALAPLRQWIAQKEYNVAETEKLLSQQLSQVGEDKIVSPEAYVAVPALQAISYSMDSQELRNLYANLLSKSMCSYTKDLVHPAFVEVIKQMSPTDAKVFNIICEKQYIPCVGLRIEQYETNPTMLNSFEKLSTEPVQRIGYDNITPITSVPYTDVRVSLDNLSRLGLIAEQYSLTQDTISIEITDSPIYQSLKSDLQSAMLDESWEYAEYPTSYAITSLGRSFYDICISPL